MEDDDFDLYNDLDEFDYKVKYEEAENQIKELKGQLDAAIKQINLLTEQKSELQNKIDNLERSFQSLLLTARSEIKRKDAQLADARREKDDLVFRRQKPPQFNKQRENQFRSTFKTERGVAIGNASNEASNKKPEESIRNKFGDDNKNPDNQAPKNVDYNAHHSHSIKTTDIPGPTVPPTIINSNEVKSSEKQTSTEKTSSSVKCEDKKDSNPNRSEQVIADSKACSGSREKPRDLDKNFQKNDDSKNENPESQRTRSDNHERDQRRYKDKNDHRKYESRRRSLSPARRDDARRRDHKGADERRNEYHSRRDSRDYRDRRHGDWKTQRDRERERDRNKEHYHENRYKDNEKDYQKTDRDRDRDREKYVSNTNDNRSHKSDRNKDDKKASESSKSLDQKSKTREEERYRSSDHKHTRSPHESNRKERDNFNQDRKFVSDRDRRKDTKYYKPSENSEGKEQHESKEGGKKRRFDDDDCGEAQEQVKHEKASTSNKHNDDNEQDLKRMKTEKDTNTKSVIPGTIEAFSEDHLQALKKQLEMELKDELSSDAKFSSDDELFLKTVKISSELHSELSNDAKFSSDEDHPAEKIKLEFESSDISKLDKNIEFLPIDSAVKPSMEINDTKNNLNKSDHTEVDMEIEPNLCENVSNKVNFACLSDSNQKTQQKIEDLVEVSNQATPCPVEGLPEVLGKPNECHTISTEDKDSENKQLSKSPGESKETVKPQTLSNIVGNEKREVNDGNLKTELSKTHKNMKTPMKSNGSCEKLPEDKICCQNMKENESTRIDNKISPKTSPLKNDNFKKVTKDISNSPEIINTSDSFGTIANDDRTNNDNQNNEIIKTCDSKQPSEKYFQGDNKDEESEEKIKDCENSHESKHNPEPKDETKILKQVDEENGNNCASHTETSSDSNSRGSSSDSTSDESTSSSRDSSSSSSSHNNEDKEQETEETKQLTNPIPEILPNPVDVPNFERSMNVNASTGNRFESSIENHKNTEENDEEIFETPIKLLKYKKHLRPQQSLFRDVTKTLEKDDSVANVCDERINKKPDEDVQSKSDECNENQNNVTNRPEENNEIDKCNVISSTTPAVVWKKDDQLMNAQKRKREKACDESSNKRSKSSNVIEKESSLDTVATNTQTEKKMEENSLRADQLDPLEKQLAFEIYGENIYEEMAKDIPTTENNQSMNLSNDSIFGSNENWKSPDKAKDMTIDKMKSMEIEKDIVNRKILKEIGLDECEDSLIQSSGNASRKEKGEKEKESETKQQSHLKIVSVGNPASVRDKITSSQTATENKHDKKQLATNQIKEIKDKQSIENKDLLHSEKVHIQDKIREISSNLKQAHENVLKSRKQNTSKNKSNEAGPANQPKNNNCILEVIAKNESTVHHQDQQKSLATDKNESQTENSAKRVAKRKINEKVPATKNNNQSSTDNRANLKDGNRIISGAQDGTRTQFDCDSSVSISAKTPNLPVCIPTPNALANVLGIPVADNIKKEDVIVTIGKPLDEKSKCRKTKPTDSTKTTPKSKSNVKMIGHIIEGFEREPSPPESNLDTSRVLKHELFKEALGITTSTPCKSDVSGQSKSSDGGSPNASLTETKIPKIVHEREQIKCKLLWKMMASQSTDSNTNANNKTSPNSKVPNSIDLESKKIKLAVGKISCTSEAKTSDIDSSDDALNKIQILNVQILQGCALNKSIDESEKDVDGSSNKPEKNQNPNNPEIEETPTGQSKKNKPDNKEVLTVPNLNRLSSKRKETKAQSKPSTKKPGGDKDGSNAVKQMKIEIPEKLKEESKMDDLSNKDLLPAPNRNQSSKTKEPKSQGKTIAKRHEGDKDKSNLVTQTEKYSAHSTETKSFAQNYTEMAKTSNSSKLKGSSKRSEQDLHLKYCDTKRPVSTSIPNEIKTIANVAEIPKSSKSSIESGKDSNTNTLPKPIQKTPSCNESSPISSISSRSDTHEKRNISIASTNYLIEKVDNNVVNVFITRKKMKKKKKV